MIISRTLELKLPYAFRELRQPARHKAYYGGRGGAKSHSFAQELILRGFERGELRWLCAREIQKSLSASVKQLLEDKIREAGLGPSSEGGNGFYRIKERSIVGGAGKVEFLFEGLRTNPDSVRSMEGLDGAWVEEANTVSKRSIELLVPTIRKPRSELWWSWNRRHTTDPVDAMFLGGDPPPDSIVRNVSWADNPWFPDVLRQEMEWDRTRDSDKWLHIWEGHPVTHSEARVFRNWTVGDIDDAIPDDVWMAPRLGADWGFSVDPTVLIECYIYDRLLYFRREAYLVGCEIDDTPALFAGDCQKFSDNHALYWRNPNGHKGFESVRRGNLITADSSRPDTIAYMRRRKFNIASAKKGPGSVEDGVEFMRSHDIVVHPDCVRTIAELTYYSYEVDKLTNAVLPKLADAHNHVIDSCRYALESVRRMPRRSSTSGLAPSGMQGPRVVTG